jgi:hypothetical protein
MKPIHFARQQVLYAAIAGLTFISATVCHAQTSGAATEQPKGAEQTKTPEQVKAAAEAEAKTTADAKAKAKAEAQANSPYPQDKDNFSGDDLRLKTILPNIADPNLPSQKWCAPPASKLRVVADNGTNSFFRFVEVGQFPKPGDNQTPLPECLGGKEVNTYTNYTLPSDELRKIGARRSGILFGALTVPFKYNLSTKKLETAPTVAPFLGWRTGIDANGLEVVPVVMLGISLKSGAAAGSGTQATLSSGAGLRLSSSKNQSWHGGIMFGRDFGGGTDASAPNQGKAFTWFSAFLGYAN